MRLEAIIPILSQMQVKIDTYTRASQVYIACPLAPWTHKNKVDNSKGMSVCIRPLSTSPCRCWNTSCDFKGTIQSLAHKYSQLSGVNVEVGDRTYSANDVLEYFEDKPQDNSWIQGLVPLEEPYRFLTPELSAKFGVQWHSKDKRVVFPVMDYLGETMIGGIGRATNKTTYHRETKYWNYGNFKKTDNLFMQHWQRHKDCILVEGPMDCLSLLRCNIPYDVYAIMGASLSEHQARLLHNHKHVLCLFDYDAAGEQALASAIKLLYQDHKILIPSRRFLEKDAGAETIENLEVVCQSTLQVRLH